MEDSPSTGYVVERAETILNLESTSIWMKQLKRAIKSWLLVSYYAMPPRLFAKGTIWSALSLSHCINYSTTAQKPIKVWWRILQHSATQITAKQNAIDAPKTAETSILKQITIPLISRKIRQRVLFLADCREIAEDAICKRCENDYGHEIYCQRPFLCWHFAQNRIWIFPGICLGSR